MTSEQLKALKLMEAEVSTVTLKECKGCKESKDISLFSIKTDSKDGFSVLCRVCNNKRMAEIYKRTKERAIFRAKRWNAENQEQMRRNGQKRSQSLHWANSPYTQKELRPN